jgi:hypothetical protein
MTTKIKKCWIKGDITEEEYDELNSLMISNLNIEAEKPDWTIVATRLEERIVQLEKKIKEIEGAQPETPKYEKWKPWNGDPSNKNYQYGAIVEHNGVIYESIFNGQNVWEPGIAGTEALWKVKE